MRERSLLGRCRDVLRAWLDERKEIRGAVLCEIHDDWAVVRRYMTINRDEEPEQKILPPAKKHAA